jgi:translation initiation factor 2-alpha kinase 4
MPRAKEVQGKGGFGEVVKARSKFDGRFYAISEYPLWYTVSLHQYYPDQLSEKVKLRHTDLKEAQTKIYREVANLSRVDHQYIVRYNACWEEDAVVSAQVTPTPVGVTMSSEENIFTPNFDDFSREQSRSQSFPRVRFIASDEDDNDDDDGLFADEDADGEDHEAAKTKSTKSTRSSMFASASSDSDDSDTDTSDTDSGRSDDTAADPSEPRGRTIAIPQLGGTRSTKPSASFTDASTDDGSVQKILYIQMEFVEKVSQLPCVVQLVAKLGSKLFVRRSRPA